MSASSSSQRSKPSGRRARDSRSSLTPVADDVETCRETVIKQQSVRDQRLSDAGDEFDRLHRLQVPMTPVSAPSTPATAQWTNQAGGGALRKKVAIGGVRTSVLSIFEWFPEHGDRAIEALRPRHAPAASFRSAGRPMHSGSRNCRNHPPPRRSRARRLPRSRRSGADRAIPRSHADLMRAIAALALASLASDGSRTANDLALEVD